MEQMRLLFKRKQSGKLKKKKGNQLNQTLDRCKCANGEESGADGELLVG